MQIKNLYIFITYINICMYVRIKYIFYCFLVAFFFVSSKIAASFFVTRATGTQSYNDYSLK